jgi:hypothetical protein
MSITLLLDVAPVDYETVIHVESTYGCVLRATEGGVNNISRHVADLFLDCSHLTIPSNTRTALILTN